MWIESTQVGSKERIFIRYQNQQKLIHQLKPNQNPKTLLKKVTKHLIDTYNIESKSQITLEDFNGDTQTFQLVK